MNNYAQNWVRLGSLGRGSRSGQSRRRHRIGFIPPFSERTF